jgi:DNA-directed RNA polymerase subunit M/transcription elongation factor TFIIS
MKKKTDPFRETIERTAKNGRPFSITIDRFDAERNPRIRQIAIEKLERAVLYEDLSQLDEWRLRQWCEENDFEKTTFLCPKCHGFGPVNMRIVIERRAHFFLFWTTEADTEVNIYHCEKCKNDYKQDDLDIERGNVKIANENKLISWLVRLKKITPDQAIARQKALFF